MPINIVMPKLGLTMKEGTLDGWLIKIGDTISKGDPIAEISSDKITNIVESPIDGILVRILAAEGDVVPVGEAIGILIKKGEHFEEQTGNVEKAVIKKEGLIKEKRIKATPLAKKIAAQHNIDLSIVTVTASSSRIRENDVLKYIELLTKKREEKKDKKTEEKAEKNIKLTGVRKIIADRMSEAWKNIPHVTEHIKVSVENLHNIRKELNSHGDIKFTFTDLITKAVISVVRVNKNINVSFIGEHIIPSTHINLGIAVATDKGLIVPVLKNADNLSLTELSKEIKELSEKARTSKLKLEDLEGGTFTITNLGMFGIESFTPIIYPGQVSILGVNAINDEVVIENDKPTVKKTMKLSFSFDHRIIDGAEAAKFLNELKSIIENPLRIMI